MERLSIQRRKHWREYSRRNQVLGNLGHSPLGQLQALLQLFLDRFLGRLLGLSLDGRAQRLGPAVEVAGQIRSGGKAVAVPRNEVVESGLELRLFETIVASSRGEPMLACFCFLPVSLLSPLGAHREAGNAATRQR